MPLRARGWGLGTRAMGASRQWNPRSFLTEALAASSAQLPRGDGNRFLDRKPRCVWEAKQRRGHLAPRPRRTHGRGASGIDVSKEEISKDLSYVEPKAQAQLLAPSLSMQRPRVVMQSAETHRHVEVPYKSQPRHLLKRT